jgi:hypothetical protein
MRRLRRVGLVLTLAGFAAYVAGVLAPVTGRELSLPVIMVGVTLVAVGGEA